MSSPSDLEGLRTEKYIFQIEACALGFRRAYIQATQDTTINDIKNELFKNPNFGWAPIEQFLTFKDHKLTDQVSLDDLDPNTPLASLINLPLIKENISLYIHYCHRPLLHKLRQAFKAVPEPDLASSAEALHHYQSLISEYKLLIEETSSVAINEEITQKVQSFIKRIQARAL